MSKQARSEALTDVQAEVGGRMKEVRELRGMSVTAAARALDIHQSTLSKIEAGGRAASIFNVIAVANRFKVSTDFLLRGQLISEFDEKMRLALAKKYPTPDPTPLSMDADTGTAPVSRKQRPAKVQERVP